MMISKTAMVLCANTFGGHEFQALEIYKDLKKLINIDLLVNSTIDMSLCEDNIDYKILDFLVLGEGNFICQYFHGLRIKKKAIAYFRTYNSVIVCAGTLEAGISLGIAIPNRKIIYVPTYVDRRDLWGKSGILYNFLFRFFVKPYDSLITINRIQAHLFKSICNSIVIPNRIKYETIDNQKIFPSSRLYFVGRFDSSKGIKELIKQLDFIENPYNVLLLFGDGPLRNELEMEAKKCKYLKVVFEGWCNRKIQNEIIGSQDIYITNSKFEGEPLAIREANARGSIVIASNIVGHRGCTNPRNRFNNEKELRELLFLADKDLLECHLNFPQKNIEDARKNGIAKLLLLL